MKCIKVGNQIASLENVKSVGIGSSSNSIRIEYKDGFVHPKAHNFHNQETVLYYIKDVNAVLDKIFEILTNGG